MADLQVQMPKRAGAPRATRPRRTFGARRAAGWADLCFEEGVAAGADATDPDRRVRECIDRLDLDALSAAVRRDADRRGVSFGSADGEHAFRIDPIPRVIDAAQWRALSGGVAQRVRALELFVRDVYGDQRIVREGVLPGRCLGSSRHY